MEGANTNTAVLKTMNDAAKALKTANNDLDVDKVMPQTHMLSHLELIIIQYIQQFRSMT